MYDFIYSDKKNIIKNSEKFILFVKKLLPKYANSLPDSAAITLYREVKKLKKVYVSLMVALSIVF